MEVSLLIQEKFPRQQNPCSVDCIVKILTTVSQHRNPVDIVTILDVSGSMQGEPIENAKAAITFLLKNMGDEDVVSLVSYSDVSRVLFKKKSKKDLKELIRVVNGIKTGGCTNIMAGVFDAEKILANSKLKDKHMMLFTDGLVNSGMKSKEKIFDTIKTIKVKRKITVNSFGLGVSYDETLMKGIAEKSSGIYYYIENSNDIKTKFANAFDLLSQICARNVCLKMKGLNGSKINKVYGLKSSEKNEIKIGNLFGDDTRNFLVNLDVMPQEKKPFFTIDITGEFADEKPIKVEKKFKMLLCDDKSQIKENQEVIDRRIIADVIREEKEAILNIKKQASSNVDFKEDSDDFSDDDFNDFDDDFESEAGLTEKQKDEGVTVLNSLLNKLESLKGKYSEVDFLIKTLEKDIKNVKERNFGAAVKSCSYTGSYSYQTTKSFV